MDLSLRKEQYSIAYVYAIAAAAGFTFQSTNVDRNSVDARIGSVDGTDDMAYPELDVQLKCISRAHSAKPTISFRVKMKNYNDLRKTRLIIPRILVVLEVPRSATAWIRRGGDHLVLHHHCYWQSLRGLSLSSNKRTVSVSIDRKQEFSVPALQAMMKRITAGGTP